MKAADKAAIDKIIREAAAARITVSIANVEEAAARRKARFAGVEYDRLWGEAWRLFQATGLSWKQFSNRLEKAEREARQCGP